MNKSIKRIMAAVLSLSLSLAVFCSVPVTAASSAEIVPFYNNTISTNTNMGINSSGKMTISYSYTGYSTTTKAIITTYIEKKGFLGLFWSRVDIGTANDEWVDTINKSNYSGTRTYQLSSEGTYRVNVEYKIYGSGGSADVIPYTQTDTY